MKANIATQIQAWEELSNIPLMQKIRDAGLRIQFAGIYDNTARFEITGDKDELTATEIRDIKLACKFNFEFKRSTYEDSKEALGTVHHDMELEDNSMLVFDKIELELRIRKYLQCSTIAAPEDKVVTEDQITLLKKKFLLGEVTLETCTYDHPTQPVRCKAKGCAETIGTTNGGGYCWAHKQELEDDLAKERATEKINAIAAATTVETF